MTNHMNSISAKLFRAVDRSVKFILSAAEISTIEDAANGFENEEAGDDLIAEAAAIIAKSLWRARFDKMQFEIEFDESTECKACSLNLATYNALKKIAIKTAYQFVSEFGEALDPSTTDWDAEAWDIDCKQLERSVPAGPEGPNDFSCLWEAYEEMLVQATEQISF